MSKLLSIAILSLLFTFASCRNSDRDRDTSTQSAEEFWIASNHFTTLMREIHKVAQVDSVLNNIPTADALKPDICNDSIVRVPNMGPFPIDLTIYYGDSTICENERNRSGKILANFDGNYATVGTTITVRTIDYKVDNFSVSAEISMKVTYSVIDTLTFDVTITNGTIIDESKGGNNISLLSGEFTFMNYSGRKSISTSDDKFLLRGKGTGAASNGVIYSAKTEFEFILDPSCNYETFGSFILSAPNQLDRNGNFGEGGECDSKMLVTIDPANGDQVVEIP